MDSDITTPKVSIIIPVFNNGLFLLESIQSILNQTFSDFEIICIDDGSVDNSLQILNAINDKRIKVFINKKNIGIAETLNRAIGIARGELIARMDGDDISLPNRLLKQVTYMDCHPETAVVVSLIQQIDIYGNSAGEWRDDKIALTPEIIREMMPKRNCIAHPTVMSRKKILVEHQYDKFFNVEDWALWLTLLSEGKVIDKINEVLLKYRIHNSSTTVSNRRKSARRIISFQWLYIRKKVANHKFKNYDFFVLFSLTVNLIMYPWKAWLKPFLSICKKIYAANPFTLLLDLIRLKNKFRSFPESTSHFFFFPFYHIGGAEKVHISILESVADFKPIVFFTKVSDNDKFLQLFERYAYCIDIGRLCYYPIFEKWTRQLISKKINSFTKVITFSSNSVFYYKMLNQLAGHVKCIDLIHAFVHQSEVGPENWSLPVAEKLSKRVFISNLAQEQMKKLYLDKMKSPNLIEKFIFIRNFVEIGQPSLTYIHESQSLNVIYIGRGTPEKRVNLIGKIATRVNSKQLPIQFTLIGNNEGSVLAEDRSSCTFTGEISDPEILKNYLRESHILLITSSREGMPLSIMEGMANAVLPISTNVGDIPDYIRDGENGFLVESDDTNLIVERISERIVELYLNPDKLITIRKKTYAEAMRMFNKDNFIASYRDLLSR